MYRILSKESIKKALYAKSDFNLGSPANNMTIFNDQRPMVGDLVIEKAIAKQIAKGVISGVVEEVDGTVYFWSLIVDTKL